MIDAAEILRAARERHGLSLSELARRAGLPPDELAAIEAGRHSPTVAALNALLFVMGEHAEVAVGAVGTPYDREQLADAAARTLEQRLAHAMAWNEFAGELARAELRPAAPPAAHGA